MKSILFLLCAFAFQWSIAQTGGKSAFPLLDYCFNARNAGLAGNFITVKDQDVNLALSNPALLNGRMHNQVSVNQSLLPGNITFGQAVYGTKLKQGTFVGSFRYADYGTFQRTEVNGISNGTFRPFEGILGIGYGKQLNPRISVGATLNFIFSQFDGYTATGLSADLAGAYTSPDESFLFTAIVKNAGKQFKSLTPNQSMVLPTNFQLGLSKKLAHAPFRVSIVMHHLNRWDLTYYDPNLKPAIDLLTGEEIPLKTPGFGEKLARHFIYQVEILASEHVHLRLGFDYQKRQELKLESRPGIAGFTTGIGLHFKRFSLDYGFMIYSKAGSSNTFTLSSSPSSWRK